MKIRIKFGKLDGTEESLVVDWSGRNPKDFPLVSYYKGKYWSFIFYDDGFMGVDFDISLTETRPSALPVDQHGKAVPVSNLELMFDIKTDFDKSCECGARFTEFPEVHMIMCPKWRKT